MGVRSIAATSTRHWNRGVKPVACRAFPSAEFRGIVSSFRQCSSRPRFTAFTTSSESRALRRPRIRYTRIAHPHNLTAAQSPGRRTLRPIAGNAKLRLEGVGRLHDVLPWNSNPVRRASVANNPSTLAAVVLAVPEAEVRLADGTAAYLAVGLPLGQDDVAVPGREAGGWHAWS
jgi:hypothetical protein